MEINIPFKFRIQVLKGYTEEGFKIIRDRACFIRKEDAEKYFDRMKSSVISGEILFLESRKTAKNSFKEVEKYEGGEEKKRILEA